MCVQRFANKSTVPKCPVSPLLKKSSEEIATNTEVMECKHIEDVLYQACVIISGPTASKGNASVFKIDAK
ncbi:putative ornithine carbamoyltransferase, partial [Operophtera brumata]